MSRKAAVVMVVEDDEDQRYVISKQLRAGGYQVQEASNGLEAIEGVRRTVPDLVLMDVRMPGMSGPQAALLLRSEFPKVPVVMISVLDMPLEKYIASTFGAVDYIPKPVDRAELIDRVRKALGGRSGLPTESTS